MAVRTGLATTNITWSAPASNDPAIEGYEIFYDGGSIAVDSDTTSVTIQSDQLLPNETHDVFVVAYSNEDTLPSEPLNTIIPPGKTPYYNIIQYGISLSSLSVVTFNITTSGELVVGATDTTITCTVTVDVPIDDIQIVLFGDVVDMVVGTDPDGSGSVSLAPSELLTENAGMYICSASVFDNMTMTGFDVSEIYILNISSENMLLYRQNVLGQSGYQSGQPIFYIFCPIFIGYWDIHKNYTQPKNGSKYHPRYLTEIIMIFHM